MLPLRQLSGQAPTPTGSALCTPPLCHNLSVPSMGPWAYHAHPSVCLPSVMRRSAQLLVIEFRTRWRRVVDGLERATAVRQCYDKSSQGSSERGLEGLVCSPYMPT